MKQFFAIASTNDYYRADTLCRTIEGHLQSFRYFVDKGVFPEQCLLPSLGFFLNGSFSTCLPETDDIVL